MGSTGGRYVRGVFSGGTFCYQAQTVFRDRGLIVHSNAPLNGMERLPDPRTSRRHSLLDLGSDEFVEGRPHPMIDATLRRERVVQEGGDSEVAVLLLDFVLGEIAAEDPAGDLLPAIDEARTLARHDGRELCVAASVCGTQLDPQGLRGQIEKLENAGVEVFETNLAAARFATELASALAGEPQS